jgi:hypothetical protein
MKAFRQLLTVTLVGLLAYAAFPAKTFAQNPPAGQPVLTNGTGGMSTDAAFIDAFVSTTGTDICSRISTAWTQALSGNSTSAVVDARGFNRSNGPWTCSASPFPTTGKAARGTLLLGNVDIPAGATWVIPTQTEVLGLGTGGGSSSGANYGTIIHAAFSCQAPCSIPVLQMGSLTGGPWFGIRIADLTVDCQAVPGCVGIYNAEAEENSGVSHVQIWDAPVYGLWVTANNTQDPGATNSGPYQGVYIANRICTDAICGSAVGVRIDGPGGTAPRLIREFNDVTVSGHAVVNNVTTLSKIACGVVIYGVSTAFTNSHVEFASTGVQVGYNSTATCFSVYGAKIDTRGVEITNVSSSPLTGGGNSVILGDSATTGTALTADVTIIGLLNVATSANTIQDYITGNTLTYAKDPYVGFYAVGHCSPGTCIKPTVLSNNP